ncbi:MAG: hypothetical protein ACSLFP_08080, partial [Acidimicrobiales bacterium]
SGPVQPVAPAVPPARPSTVAGTGAGRLPVTGTDATRTAQGGLGLVLLGLGLVAAGWRRRPRASGGNPPSAR